MRPALPLLSLLLAPFAMAQARFVDPDHLVPRADARAAVDPVNGDLWLLGGRRDRSLDLWRLRAGAWQRMAPSPLPGIAKALAWDPARALLMAVLRRDDGTQHLYQFDGTSWQARVVLTGLDHQLLWDPVRQHLLLWSQIVQSTTGHLQRWNGQSLISILSVLQVPYGPFAFDSSRGRAVTGHYSGTHEWNGTSWQQVPAPLPSLLGAQATTDPLTGRVVVFGSDQSSGAPLAFAWNGLNWGAWSVAGMPARTLPVVIGNPVTGRVVLCGGGDPFPHGDAYAFDGVSWQQVTPDTADPVFRNPRLVHDGPGQALLFDGGENVTTPFPPQTARLQNGTWSLLQPQNSPSVRYDFAMASDPASGRVWLFGGNNGNADLADFWLWNGGNWQQLPGGPPARSRHGLCFDQRRQRLVLYGGSAGSDTWEHDGTSWLLRAGSFPPHNYFAHLSWDAMRERSVLVTFSPAGLTVWEWDGSNWFSTNPANRPAVVGLATLVTWDPERERVVLINPTDVLQGNSHEWDGSDWRSHDPDPRLVNSALCAAGIPGVGVVLQHGQARFASTLRSDRPASVLTFGIGCDAGMLPMALSSNHAWLGDSWRLQAAPVFAAATALFAIGFSNTQAGTIPLPFDLGPAGWPGCRVLVSPDLVLAAPWNNGSALLAVSLPAVPAMAGMRLFAQSLVIESARFQASNGTGVVLGSRW